ncbi:MAG UNVERIFIED_CONTAM: hypothetical protein LVR18_01250 [Planctomycetaceae bacterium]
MAHPALADAFTANRDRARWHDRALWFVREKRDRMASGVPEWELLRETASAIKQHTQSLMADYLEQFEARKGTRSRRSLGRGCRRTQPNCPFDSAKPRRKTAGEKQIHAHRRMSPQSLSGTEWDRSD